MQKKDLELLEKQGKATETNQVTGVTGGSSLATFINIQEKSLIKTKERQFKQSIEGQELTASLMQVIRSFAPSEITANLLQSQSRMLLGEKYAKMLGIAETNIPNTLLKVYNTTSVLMSNFF